MAARAIDVHFLEEHDIRIEAFDRISRSIDVIAHVLRARCNRTTAAIHEEIEVGAISTEPKVRAHDREFLSEPLAVSIQLDHTFDLAFFGCSSFKRKRIVQAIIACHHVDNVDNNDQHESTEHSPNDLQHLLRHDPPSWLPSMQ